MKLTIANLKDINIFLAKLFDVYNPIMYEWAIKERKKMSTKSHVVSIRGPYYSFGSRRIHISSSVSDNKTDENVKHITKNVLYEDAQKEIDKLDHSKYEALEGFVFSVKGGSYMGKVVE